MNYYIHTRNYILDQWELITSLPDLNVEVKEEYTKVIHKIIKELEQRERGLQNEEGRVQFDS